MPNTASAKHNPLAALPTSRKQYLPLLKSFLQDSANELHQKLADNTPIENILQQRSQHFDQLLTACWELSQCNEHSCCLIAIGGYGHELLFPYSDLDILILTAPQQNAATDRDISHFLTLLWDLGITLGHQVRNLNQTIAFIQTDLNFATSILDHRFLCGHQSLYQDLQHELQSKQLWEPRDFFNAKLQEQAQRHQKYGNTSYNLEPNIKEGPGGLRDIQTILWIAQHYYQINDLSALVSKQIMTKAELAAITSGCQYLQYLRSALHTLAGRNENRLLFDYQAQLAQQFYPETTDPKAAIERFMKRYYRTVKELNEVNDMLLQWLDETIFNPISKPETTVLNSRFNSRSGYIEATSKNVFMQHPSAMLEIFLLLAHNPELKGLRASTIRLLRQNRHLIDETFRLNPENQQLFLQLINTSTCVAPQFRLMNRYGILGRYLPAFGDLIGQMQYDLYHVYTVDRHLVTVLKNIDYFTLPESEEKFPVCHGLIQSLAKREVLYLSALFHDIGKGRGGDHSIIGGKITLEFCQMHQLNTDDTELLIWLVENHLLMSITAQRMDIYDPEVIKQFADKIQVQPRLDHLYLLTCADIYATNEKLWNSWRSSLLRDLYNATTRYFADEDARRLQQNALVDYNQQRAAMIMQQSYQFAEDELTFLHQLWANWHRTYFVNHHPKKIAEHSQLVLQTAKTDKAIVSTTTHQNLGGTEIFIYMATRFDVFATTTNIIDKLNLNIVEAQILTTKDGFTLDTYVVLDKDQKLTDPKRIIQVNQQLQRELSKPKKRLTLSKRYTSRRLRHFNDPSKIQFKQDTKRELTILEIDTPDRAGLLARIAFALLECKVRLVHAKIATLGERVEDVFTITDRQHQPITDEEKLAEIEQTLQHYLKQGR